MKSLTGKILIFAAAGIISAACAMTSFAASAIKSVKINVKSDGITVGSARNIDDITVNTSGGNYSIDEVDFSDRGDLWEITDVPKITVHLSANDNYYFSVYKADDFKISGAELIEARRENSSRDLYVDLQLPSLENQVAPIGAVSLGTDGVASWETSRGASGYQVKLMRGTSTVGGVQTVSVNTVNLRYLMTKAGTYNVKVRAVGGGNASKTGSWITSNDINISQDEAANIVNERGSYESQGSWQRDVTGWWFSLPDGTYVTGAWRKIKGEYYYFNTDGYMLVGWQLIDGTWYYMDTVSGRMLANTTTPDGYFVSVTGAYSPGGK